MSVQRNQQEMRGQATLKVLRIICKMAWNVREVRWLMEGDKVDNVMWSGVQRATRVIAPFQVTEHDIRHSAAETKIS